MTTHALLIFIYIRLLDVVSSYGPDVMRSSAVRLQYSSLKSDCDVKREPIILLHGLLGSARNFRTIERLLSQELDGKHDIISMDARNHGSSSLIGPYHACYTTMSADVIETLNSLNIDKFHIIGHSMGGKTASMTALNFPDRVMTLSVLDMAPIVYSSNDFSKVSSIIESLYSTQHALKTAKSKQDLLDLLNLDDPVMKAFLESNLIVKEEGLEWRFQLEGIYASLANFREFPVDKYACYDKPSLFLKGGLSNYITTKDIPSIAQYFTNYYVKTIKQAGHWLHHENPSETVTMVSKLIKSVY